MTGRCDVLSSEKNTCVEREDAVLVEEGCMGFRITLAEDLKKAVDSVIDRCLIITLSHRLSHRTSGKGQDDANHEDFKSHRCLRRG